MRYLIFGLILLGVSVYLGIELSNSHNMVIVTFNHWVIETSLWVSLLLLIICFILFYLLMRLLSKAFNLSKYLQRVQKSRREHKGRLLTHKGLCEFAEGHWRAAENTLLKAAHHNRRPLIDYLAAAKAAQAQYAYDRRDTYLRRASLSDKAAHIAIGLTQAQLQIDSKQWERALATLQHLQQQAPQHGFILKLLAQVYVELNEWPQCQKLLHPLKKANAMTQAEFNILEKKVYFALLMKASKKELAILEATWKATPRVYRHDAEFIYQYAAALLHWQQDDTTFDLIIHAQKRHWDSKFAELFGQLRIANTTKHLEIAEQWLQKHPQDQYLLMTLGELCLREKLWGKAENYLRQTLAIAPSPTAYIKLGSLYEELGEPDEARTHFQAAIKLLHHSP